MLILHKNIHCDSSSEPSRCDGSDEGSQCMVSMRNQKLSSNTPSYLELCDITQPWFSAIFSKGNDSKLNTKGLPVLIYHIYSVITLEFTLPELQKYMYPKVFMYWDT